MGFAALTSASFGSIYAQNTPSPIHIFVEESGVFGGPDPFCIGAILTKEPKNHLNHVWHLRLRHHYRSRLLYRSTDKFKQPFARSVVEYFFRTPDLRFAARIIKKRETDQQMSRSARETIYHQHYKKLILDSAPKNLPVHLTLVNHSTGGSDGLLRSYLRDELRDVVAIQVARLRENDLLQLANLLAGSVSEGDILANKVKLSSVLQLKQILHLDELTSPALWRNPKFKVRVV